MNPLKIMRFNEDRKGYIEPTKEEKKEIELNNYLKILPQEIKEKETQIKNLKKIMEGNDILQSQISEEKDFYIANFIDTNIKFVQHSSIEPRFFKYNKIDK
jgi:hypothetical protein